MTYQEIRECANTLRNIPLQTVLENVGARRDPYDKSRWHTPLGSISVTGMKFMNWSTGFGGGGAIDLVMHLHRSGFKSAVEWLHHRFASAAPLPPATPPPRPNLNLPAQDDRNLNRVRHYLTADRALPPALIDTLIASNTLYADHRANAVFVMLDHNNRHVGAELRGTSPHRWHGMASGTRKDMGYFSISSTHARTAVLCESAIDAISCHALHPEYLCISTSGARPNPLWLTSVIRQGYRVYCGFDSDTTGEHMAQSLIATHPQVKRLRPSKHDWNQILTSHTL